MSLFSIGSKDPKLPVNGRYWIADTARIIGDVVLKNDVSIWFGAVIRGDNDKVYVGSGSNIQENCVLHTDIKYPIKIGMGCTIGHGVILHGCSIGDNCIIGMGAIILNGARIGDDCIVAAGALVSEGKDFSEPGKLILGTPARVIRELRLDERDKLRSNALSYRSKAIEFNKKLRKYEPKL